MIKTTLGDKFVGFAIVFVTPGQEVIEAAAQLGEEAPEGGPQHVQPMVQLQILDGQMNVLETAMVDGKALSHLLTSGKALGKEAVAIGDLVDKHFDKYREKAKETT